MVDILDSVKSRILKLNKIIMEKESALHEAPDGLVNIAKTATRTQFYYKENSSDKNKRYLRKDEKELIKILPNLNVVLVIWLLYHSL